MRTAEWKTRLLGELQKHHESCFVTLTYAGIPPITEKGYESLYKPDLQNFFKRLRQKLKPLKIKYYACGEYGDQTKRPHYHAIIFGWQPQLKDLKKIGNYMTDKVISAAWGLGHVTVGTVTDESIQYVTGYIRKAITGRDANNDKYQHGVQPAFSLSSQNMQHDNFLDIIKKKLKSATNTVSN